MVADLDLGGVGAVASSERAAERYSTLCDDDVTEACWKLGNLLAEDDRHDDAARLYESLGWVRVGDIPGYALMPRGEPCGTTYYYRNLNG